MVFRSFFNDERKVLFPLWLVGAFIALNFTADLTKLKNLSIIIMAITAVWFLFKSYRTALKPLKNSLFYSIILFVLAIFYSLLISIDPQLSLDSMDKPVLNSLLLFSFLIPVVLHKCSSNQIARMVLLSVTVGLACTWVRDLLQYIEDYKQGIMPFTEFTHRHLSDSYVFCFPVILCLWHIYKKNSLAHWACLISVSLITVIFMLGTFARGAWLSAVVMTVIIVIFNKEKMLALLGIATLLCGAALLLSYDNAQDHPLTKKMEQTTSSNRYGGGTQGSALELILQNPIKGYGYGNDLYHQVYNSQVADHPEWIYKQSLGPHNILLAIWFAAGLPGLVAIIMMTLCALNYAFRAYTNSKGNIITAQAVLLLMASFFGWTVVRGAFENVYLNELGIQFGLLMALGYRIKAEKMPE